MISYKDIKLAVNTLLSNQFQIEIQSNDVKEGFKRPSFFVELDDMERSSTDTQVEKNLTIRILYFPSDRYSYSSEILGVQEELEELFDLKLHVADRHLNIQESVSDIVDGVLDFSFEIHFFDGRPSRLENGSDIQIMQELLLKRG
ncbi:phage tail terminator family protein [Bacillus infantis]|uniref:phage tail terminator family protein n=1 Tax=Bacillus infantis TaxID=324767 RepID=UPI003CF7B26D